METGHNVPIPESLGEAEVPVGCSLFSGGRSQVPVLPRGLGAVVTWSWYNRRGVGT